MASSPLLFIDKPAGAAALLDPMRLRLLQHLETPDSATGLAKRLRLPRQKVNYHLRELESHGLVELVEHRRKRNCIERLVRATALCYVINPDLLGGLAADPSRVADRFSSAYVVALAAKVIRDTAHLQREADKAGKKLATLSMESEIAFASAAKRNQFAEELATTVARLVAKYHDDHASGSRRFRLVIAAHPATNSRQGEKQ
jgi:DNA-binding transcriptional ArsR family regulator